MVEPCVFLDENQEYQEPELQVSKQIRRRSARNKEKYT
jgi:hypothetical protein